MEDIVQDNLLLFSQVHVYQYTVCHVPIRDYSVELLVTLLSNTKVCKCITFKWLKAVCNIVSVMS